MNFKAISVVIFFVFASVVGYAQNDLNAYKYIIIPNKFEFQRFDDQYQLNSLTQFLFKKQGYNTLKIEDRPNDLYDNACLGLQANVINNSNMFTTKVVIELVDCYEKVVYKSEEGRSKIKDYKKGYHEAIRIAFESVKAFDYKFDESLVTTKEPNVVEETNTTEVTNNSSVETAQKVEEAAKSTKVSEDIAVAVGVTKASTKEEVLATETSEVVSEKKAVEKTLENTLYAQTTEVGYQLVDKTPKVVFILLKSTRENYYFLKNKTGVVFKENDKWIAEYYNENELLREELRIKF